MPKRKSHRKKSRRGGNPIAAATQNLTAATNARVEKTKQQVTNTVAAAKAQAQHVIKKGQEAVHHAKTTAENAAARQINKAAAAVRPPPPPPSVVAQRAAANILAPVHRAIDHGAHAVRKAIAHTHTPGVSAHHVAPAAKQAHQAVKKELQHQKLLHAARSTAPMAGGSRKRRKHRRKHRRTHRRVRRRTRRRRRRGGVNTFAETPAGPIEHQAIMQENADKLLRYYACHAAGHSRDPLGPKGVAAARSAIMDTLKKYQCKIPELQMQLSRKYGGTLELTNDYCGQGGGRRRTRRRRRRRGGMPPGGAAAHQQWATTSQNPSQLGPWPTYHLDAQGNLVAGSGPVSPGTPPRKKRPKSATKRGRPTKGGRRRRTRRKHRRRH